MKALFATGLFQLYFFLGGGGDGFPFTHFSLKLSSLAKFTTDIQF